MLLVPGALFISAVILTPGCIRLPPSPRAAPAKREPELQAQRSPTSLTPRLSVSKAKFLRHSLYWYNCILLCQYTLLPSLKYAVARL